MKALRSPAPRRLLRRRRISPQRLTWLLLLLHATPKCSHLRVGAKEPSGARLLLLLLWLLLLLLGLLTLTKQA
jgi:hypothetical protein